MDNNDKTTNVSKIVARAVKKKAKESGPWFSVHYDDLFRTLIVHSYGTFEEFNSIKEALFADPHKEDRWAKGYCVFGPFKKEPTTNVCLTWVIREPLRSDAMLTFVHEIVHLSQNLADQINYKSSAEYGGIQGCIVEREYIRLMRDFMGEKVEGYPLSEATESAARKAISEKAKTRRKRG